MKSGNFIFETNNVYFGYEGNYVLKDISLDVDPGKNFVILGANGSGKSTLLKILAGLIFPIKGEVLFKGQRIDSEFFSNPQNSCSFRKTVGILMQDSDAQLFSPTVYDDVSFGPLQLGLDERQVRKVVKKALDDTGTSPLAKRVPFTLSGGEKRKAALASVIAVNPEVFLFDEPTTHLDPKTVGFLIDYIRKLNSSKKTVITATNDLAFAFETGGECIILSQKHNIVGRGEVGKILKKRSLLERNNLIHKHLHRHISFSHSHNHIHRKKKS